MQTGRPFFAQNEIMEHVRALENESYKLDLVLRELASYI